MSTKILKHLLAAFSIALIAGILVSTTVSAQEGSRYNRLRRSRPTLGKVTAVGSRNFTIQKKDGEVLTFEYNEQTDFRNRENTQLSSTDLKVGGWIGVVVGRFADPNIARLVVILPIDFDPAKLEACRGRIISVAPESDQFTLQNPAGEKTIQIDDETKYTGQIEDFGDLEAGLIVRVVGEIADGESLIANHVLSGSTAERFAGKITSINQNMFRIKDRLGTELTFQVDRGTHYRLFGKGAANYGDFEIGMVVLVNASESDVGTYLAQLVVGFRRR